MRSHFLAVVAAASTFLAEVKGQTSTDCNPTTNTTCPSDAALGETITVDFTAGASSSFTADSGTSITYSSTNGAEFIMDSTGLASTIVSDKYFFFGNVSVTLRAANGTGVVSSFVLESDDLDEIDWEWLGGDTTQVETNYFGKGNTTSYDRYTWVSVSTPQDTWHTYSLEWTSAYVKWYVDGDLVRTLLYDDALEGKNFPQTPCRVKIGIWDGGAKDEATGTVEWAGGYTDLDDAPFIMYVKSITIADSHTGATEYTYGNESGDWESIEVTYGNSTSSETSTVSSSSESTTATVSSSTISPDSTTTVPSSTSSSSSSTESNSSGSTGSAISASNSTGSSGSSGSSATVSNSTTAAGSSSSTASSTSAGATTSATTVTTSEATGRAVGALWVLVMGLGMLL